jgi:protein tyrosine kinase modulator
MGDQIRHGLDLARAAWGRRKWLAIFFFVLPLAALLGSVPFLPDIYKASAVVLVERQQVPEEFVKSTVTSGLETRLRTISQEILSRSRLEALIDRFDLYPDLRHRVPPEVVVERLRRDIEVEFKGVDAQLRGGAIVAFKIGYVGSDPRVVAKVANTLAGYFLEENTRVREREASGTAAFLRRQLGEVKQRLAAQEQRRSAFKSRYLGETPQHMESNLSILERLNTQLRLNNENQNRALERRDLLARRLDEAESSAGVALAAPSLTGAPGVAPAAETPAARLHRLRQELAELRTRYKESYPDVVQMRSRIATVEQQLRQANAARTDDTDAKAPVADAKAVAAPLNPQVVKLKESIGDIEVEISTLKAEERRLREDLAVYQRRVENTPYREQEFQELSRDYDTTSELYRTLLKRYEEAQLAETLEQRQKGEQFRVLEPAIPPAAPFAPKRPWLLAVGVALSAGIAVGALVVAEQLDGSFHTADEVRAFTTTPIVANIPPMITAAEASRRRWRLALVAVSIFVGAALLGGVSHRVAAGNEQLVWLLVRGRV